MASTSICRRSDPHDHVPSVPLPHRTGLGSFSRPVAPNLFSMNNFSTPGSEAGTRKLSCEEHFAFPNKGVSVEDQAGMLFIRTFSIIRSPTQGGPGGHSLGKNCTRNTPPRKTNVGIKTPLGQRLPRGSGFNQTQQSQLIPGGVLQPIVPLEMSVNRWTASRASGRPQALDLDAPELVWRKVTALLNKLPMEKFDSISD